MIKKIVEKLQNKKIVILGFGREGESTYLFIRKYMGNVPLTIIDENSELQAREILKQDKNLTLFLTSDYFSLLENYDWIIKSPGFSFKNQDVRKIKDKITSQMELLLEVHRDKVIGITGTKGKSTTSSLLYEIIKSQNENVVLVGNIGIPVFSVLEKCNNDTLFIMEMSSHQLEYLKVSPHIGVVLNLFEDHLDHAGSVEHYHNIKLHMFENQTKEDIMVYCGDNETLNEIVKQRKFKSKSIRIDLKGLEDSLVFKKEHAIFFQNEVIYNEEEPRHLLGVHNLENIVVAIVVAELLCLNHEKVLSVVRNFQPLPYRLQNIGEKENVIYYVDTVATIPEATIDAIETLQNVNTLIFGGMDRGISYSKFIEYLNLSSIEHFICMPTTGFTIGKKLSKEKVFYAKNLEEAVRIAKKVTKEKTICLLSPAASSYEQFKNYKEKAEKFKEYVFDNE